MKLKNERSKIQDFMVKYQLVNSIVPSIQETVLNELDKVSVEEQEMLFAGVLSYENIVGTYQ